MARTLLAALLISAAFIQVNKRFESCRFLIAHHTCKEWQLRSWRAVLPTQVTLAASASSNHTLNTLLKGKLVKGVLVKGAKHAVQAGIGAGAGLVSRSHHTTQPHG